MSGLIPDLASWALRGQASGENDADNETENANDTSNAEGETLTPEEMRAQRLQRMELMQQRQREQQQAEAATNSKSEPEPMQIDSPPANKKPTAATSTTTPSSVSATPPVEKKKKRKAEYNDPANKLQRKKEIILRKVLSILLEDSSLPGAADSPLPKIAVGPAISVHSIAEILALQVAAPTLGPMATSTNQAFAGTGSSQATLMAYLADCHRKAAEELKTLRSSSANAKKESTITQEHNAELMELLQEIQKQVVSYAATVLMEPTLFTLGKDSSMQLAKCLYTSLSDISASITFGVGGNASSSFYFGLVEELLSQNPESLERVVQEIVQTYTTALEKCESVLEPTVVPSDWMGSVPVGVDTSPMALVSALTALCMHKKVAEIVARSPHFLLPSASSPVAAEVIRPPPPPQFSSGGNGNRNQLLQQFMALANQQHRPSYKKRSGPALEKKTLLGLCLRMGIPVKNNTAFAPGSILRQSLSSVESATSQQRQQLRLYQEACNQFIHHLIKAGKGAREQVLTWFTDAILVNVGASATRPDPAKVSGQNTLLNISVSLLKLCEPFVTDPAKHKLIDPQFCSSPSAHKGVYATEGDDAVPRLGEDDDATMTDEYNPKNAFVTQLFFLTARSMHYGLASSLSQHETLLRQLSHLHWMITSRGSSADLQSDPQFAMYVSRQRAQEVALFQEDIVADHLRFLQLIAKVLYEMDAAQLKTMPEDFVSDVCDTITSIAKLKAKLLRGIDVSYTFKLVVKLLSPTYASVSCNHDWKLPGWTLTATI